MNRLEILKNIIERGDEDTAVIVKTSEKDELRAIMELLVDPVEVSYLNQFETPEEEFLFFPIDCCWSSSNSTKPNSGEKFIETAVRF